MARRRSVSPLELVVNGFLDSTLDVAKSLPIWAVPVFLFILWLVITSLIAAVAPEAFSIMVNTVLPWLFGVIGLAAILGRR